MNILIILMLIFSLNASAITVEDPQSEALPEFTISSPDDFVATLGKVDYIIDWSSQSDSLLELKLKRQDVFLPNGKKASVFAYDLKSGMVIAARDPVKRITITSADKDNVLAVFYAENNKIIAPHAAKLGLYDLKLNPRPFSYSPSQTPKDIRMEVTILLDSSGSMGGFMEEMFNSADKFTSNLPRFSYCRILQFGQDIKYLNSIEPCPHLKPKQIYKNSNITAYGGTPLFSSIEKAITERKIKHKNMPHFLLAITDGKNSELYDLSMQDLIKLKEDSGAKLAVFWLANHSVDHLKDVADFEITSTKNIKNDLDTFFSSVGLSISGVQTLKVVKP